MSKTEKEIINDGMTCFRNGELGKAEEIFRNFMKTFPESDLADNACYNLAKISMKRGQKQRALEWIEYLLANYPKSDAAYFAEDEKVELLRSMGRGPKETADERYHKGKLALKASDINEAEKIFTSFLEDFPESDLIDNAHYNLAAIFKDRGETEQARKHIDIIMNQYPDSDAAIYAKDLLEDPKK